MADGSVTTAKLDPIILKYLKPEISAQPQAQTVYADANATFSVTAEGKYLTYQWKKDGVDLTGETNATLNITDANATLHDGNYSVVVSNDFGSVGSDITEFLVSSFSVNSIPNIELWLDSSDSSTITLNNGKVSIWHDKSGNENNATQTLVNKQPEFGQDQNGKFVRFTSSYTSGGADSVLADNYLILSPVSGKSSFFVIDHDGSKLSMLLGSKDSQKSYILIGSDDFAISLDGYNKSPGPLDIGNWWFNGTFQSTGRDLGARGQIPLNTPSMHSVIYELDDPMFSFYRIGSYRDNKAGFGGKIREIIIFNGYLTEADRQNIEGYLAHKWSLTTNLPADHPYKNKSP
ncbi:MAG: immunoglobulin domain-containing protein [Verrucomicrobiota bacterium]|nr:immunoglobulin domain-containing protein [Verrucomicrobiota bacterium]